jgi:hypothetical protein
MIAANLPCSSRSVRGHFPHVRPRSIGQFAVLLAGLAACAGKKPVQDRPPEPASKPMPSWLSKFPSACALGESGPTLVPTEALAEARRKARALLATRDASYKNRSATVVSSSNDKDDVRQLVFEQSEGTAQGTEILTMWYDSTGSGPSHVVGAAYAIACPADTTESETMEWARHWRGARVGPSWLYSNELHSGGQRLCVVGVCGPTLQPSDAHSNAEDVARLELAEAISIHATTASAVLDDDETLYAAVTRSCDSCQETAKAGRVVERWFDETGQGPIPYAGTAYALMCLER